MYLNMHMLYCVKKIRTCIWLLETVSALQGTGSFLEMEPVTSGIGSRIQLTKKSPRKVLYTKVALFTVLCPPSWANSLCEELQYEVKRSDKKL